jgi:hypothetical protein
VLIKFYANGGGEDGREKKKGYTKMQKRLFPK